MACTPASNGDVLSMPAFFSTAASPAFWPTSVPVSTSAVSPSCFKYGLMKDLPVAASSAAPGAPLNTRSEEHTSELQSLMRISYAVFCLKKKKNKHTTTHLI